MQEKKKKKNERPTHWHLNASHINSDEKLYFIFIFFFLVSEYFIHSLTQHDIIFFSSFVLIVSIRLESETFVKQKY